MLRRRRSGGALGALASSNTPQVPTIMPTSHTPSNVPVMLNVPNVPITNGAAHRIRLVPHLDSRRSLRFDPITRDVVEGDPALRIGRFTERSGVPISQANALNSNKLAFKSKVVSRAHAEVWCEHGGKFYIKDTKSSSLARFLITSASLSCFSGLRAHSSLKTVTLSNSVSTIKVVQKTYTNASVSVLR